MRSAQCAMRSAQCAIGSAQCAIGSAHFICITETRIYTCLLHIHIHVYECYGRFKPMTYNNIQV